MYLHGLQSSRVERQAHTLPRHGLPRSEGKQQHICEYTEIVLEQIKTENEHTSLCVSNYKGTNESSRNKSVWGVPLQK